MIRKLLAGLALSAAFSAAVEACTVCYGDPNSLQVKGAEAGVLFLLGVVVFVLLAIAGMILFFAVRARRIGRVSNTVSLPIPR